MDVISDHVISETARRLADAVGALSRQLKGKSPYVPPDVLELEALLLTPWIRVHRLDLFQEYDNSLREISEEAHRLYRQRSSEPPSVEWELEHLAFSIRCFKLRNMLRHLAAHIDGRSEVPDALTPNVPQGEEPAETQQNGQVAEKPPGAEDAAEDGALSGEWSLKMTGAEAARRLTGKDKARFRDIQHLLLEGTGFERIEGTKKIRIRLDTLSLEDRNKIQEPAKSSTIFDHLRPS